MKNAFIAIAALAPVAIAQAGAWEKCGGGDNYTGPTTCIAGFTCTFSNYWYSQCLPGSAPPVTTTTRPVTTTARTTTSIVPTTTPSTTTRVITTTTSSRTSTSTSTPVGQTTTRSTTAVITTTSSATTTGAPATTSGAVVSGNPFNGVKLFPNPYYASEILNLAIPSLPSSLHAKASAVAKVPTFAWLDTASKIPLMESHLVAIRAANQAGETPPYAGTFVVYDLPDRDCAAAASNGEYSIANGGAALYKTYIDNIRALIVAYSDVKIILIIEPDSLANLITNLSVPKCAGAQSTYLTLTNYAVTKLALPNVSMYLDGGHGGWLGWPANIGPAAQMYAQVFTGAGSPPQLRGLALNVANYNAWSLSSPPAYTTPNPNYDEQKYVNALAPLLTAAGFPAHFVMDTGRNGVQPTAQIAQGDWCNLIGTGFGVRPTTATGNSLVDAFVWIKPGGEADGTSDTSATRYDYHCGLADALKPAPEAGTWFQAYFQQLLVNANPTF